MSNSRESLKREEHAKLGQEKTYPLDLLE